MDWVDVDDPAVIRWRRTRDPGRAILHYTGPHGLDTDLDEVSIS